tara:strand:+ start:628 stop:900 length:273 start_codon:yes stop_codon:yes gene_type:complete
MLAPEPKWFSEAICKIEQNPDTFFPERGASTRQAKALCRLCPVQEECLDYAVVNFQEFGIWAGTTTNIIRRLRKIKQKSNQDAFDNVEGS